MSYPALINFQATFNIRCFTDSICIDLDLPDLTKANLCFSLKAVDRSSLFQKLELLCIGLVVPNFGYLLCWNTCKLFSINCLQCSFACSLGVIISKLSILLFILLWSLWWTILSFVKHNKSLAIMLCQYLLPPPRLPVFKLTPT